MDMSTYSVVNEKQLPGSAPLADPRFLQWLLQQQSEKQSPQPSSPGSMLQYDPEYTFTQESDDDQGSWPIPAQLFQTGSLPVHLNGSAPQHARLSPSIYAQEWNPYTMSPNEANSNSTFMVTNNYPQNTLSPFPMQSRTPLSLPQLSPTSSDLSLSPSYATSHLSTPTTPGSAPQSFMPSPTLSQGDQMLQQKFQVLNPDRLRYTHREQLHLFREALNLPREGAGPFIPQLMYKPHTTSDRKRYVEDILLEAPIYFIVEHSDQYGISLQDALHSRVKNLVNREQVVFEGRGPSVSIRLEWPGYRQWSRQIPTKDFRSPPGPITIAKLAKNVAKCVQRFMQDRKSLPMEEGSDIRWRIGDRPNDIKLEDLMLVSIHHVSLGSWQPHLRLRRPLSNIPIHASPSSTGNDILLFSNSNPNHGWVQ